MARAVRLYLAALLSFGHRLRHDLAREVVVLLCSLVLLATFLYVFNDFLNVQVAALSEAMRERFAEGALAALLVVATAVGARFVRDELRAEASLRRAARRMGETRGVVAAYLALRFATVLAVVHGAAWYGCFRWLMVLPVGMVVELEAGMLAATGVAAAVTVLPTTVIPRPKAVGNLRMSRAATADSRHPKIPDGLRPGNDGDGNDGGVVATLVRWRLRQMLTRNRATKLCLLLSLPFLLLAALAAFRQAPLFVAAASGFAAGFLVALSLAFQMSEDLGHAWVERGFGISHAQFVSAYERVGVVLAAGFGLAGALLFAAAASAGGAPITFETFNGAAKVAAAVATAPVIAPWLLMQIDGRRPAIGALTILIVGLFVGTAVFAHWLALVLLLLLRHFAAQTQDKRFYRA